MIKRQGAIIGFGNIAEKGHLPSYLKSAEAEIVAVMDPSEQRRAAAQAVISGVRVYSSVEDLFRTEKVDFVDICTPPASHAALAQQALEHGMHVLCEKPLVLSEEDYVQLAKTQRERQRTVFAVHNWKYAPIIRQALDWIREGRIGQVWHVELFVLRDNVCKGTTQGANGAAGPAENWRQDPAVSGGGILVDHGWHAFYLLTNLIGADPGSILSNMHFGEDAGASLDEVAQVLIQFPQATGYIHLTWRAPMRRNTMHIQGVAGSILIDDDRLLLNARDGAAKELRFPALSAGSHHADWFEAMLPDFVEEMKNPAKRGANFREAGWCVALTKAAYLSRVQHFKTVDVAFPGQKPAPLATR